MQLRLSEERRDLELLWDEVDRDREQLTAAAGAVENARAVLDRELERQAERSAEIEREKGQLAAEREHGAAALAAHTAELETARRRLAERIVALDAEEAARSWRIAARERELGRWEQLVAEQAASLDARAREVDATTRPQRIENEVRIDFLRREWKEAIDDLDAREREVADRQEQLDKAEAALTESRKRYELDATELTRRRAALESERMRSEARKAELVELEARAGSEEERLVAARRDIARRQAQARRREQDSSDRRTVELGLGTVAPFPSRDLDERRPA
jgi:chromosome segregation ATPase